LEVECVGEEGEKKVFAGLECRAEKALAPEEFEIDEESRGSRDACIVCSGVDKGLIAGICVTSYK